MSTSLLPRPKRVALAAVLAALLSGLLAAGTVIVLGNSVSAGKSLSASAIIALCGGDTKCQAGYVVDSVAVISPTPTADQMLKGLNLASEITAKETGGCHSLTHEVGRLAFTRFGDAVLDVHTEDCGAGFTHGWMIALTESLSVPEATKLLVKYCKKDSGEVGCIHGIGHAFGQQALPALEMQELCTQIASATTIIQPTRTPLNGCVAGWVMDSTHPVKWSSMEGNTEVEKLCEPLTGEASEVCLAMGLRRWAEAVSPDNTPRLEYFSNHCKSVVKSAEISGDQMPILVCLSYFGEAVMKNPGSTIPDPVAAAKKANIFCNIPHHDLCIAAIKSSLAVDANGSQDGTEKFCSLLSPNLSAVCKLRKQ